MGPRIIDSWSGPSVNEKKMRHMQEEIHFDQVVLRRESQQGEVGDVAPWLCPGQEHLG